MNFARRAPLNRAIMKYDAKAALQNRVLISFAAYLFPMLLPFITQFIKIEFGGVHILLMLDQLFDITVLIPSVVISILITLFVQNPMGVCLARFFLRLNRDRQNKPSPLSVCDCFGQGFWKLVGATFLRDAIVFLSALVPFAISMIFPKTLRLSVLDGDLIVQSGGFFQVFIIIAVVVGLMQSIRYSMLVYVLAEHPELTIREAIRESLSLTRGRVWELFILQLSFIGWALLVTFSAFLAAIYVYPYIETTLAAYYLAFTKPPDWNDEEAAIDPAA